MVVSGPQASRPHYAVTPLASVWNVQQPRAEEFAGARRVCWGSKSLLGLEEFAGARRVCWGPKSLLGPEGTPGECSPEGGLRGVGCCRGWAPAHSWGGLRRLSTEGAAGALSVGHGWCVGPRQAAMSSARRRTLQLGWSHAPAAGGTPSMEVDKQRRGYSSRPQREAALAALWAAAAAQASQRQLRGSTIRSVCYRSSVTHS